MTFFLLLISIMLISAEDDDQNYFERLKTEAEKAEINLEDENGIQRELLRQIRTELRRNERVLSQTRRKLVTMPVTETESYKQGAEKQANSMGKKFAWIVGLFILADFFISFIFPFLVKKYRQI